MPSNVCDWATVVSFGFNKDRNGRRRTPVWPNIFTLCFVLPAASVWAMFRIATTHTGLGLWLLAFGLYVFTMFGVTLGNHRYWTHRGFKVRRPMRVLLALASALSLQGNIEQWVLTHRAHHRHPDVIGLDPHSPYEYVGWRGLKGLVWAQGIWLLFEQEPALVPHRDLTDDTVVQTQRKLFPYVAVGQFPALLAFYPLFGLNAVLIAGALRASVLLTSTGMVNSVCHRWGSRARDSAGREFRADESRNNLFVALISGGEGNHAWHHVDPVCPCHGRKIDVDPRHTSAGVQRDRQVASGRHLAAHSAADGLEPRLQREATKAYGPVHPRSCRETGGGVSVWADNGSTANSRANRFVAHHERFSSVAETEPP